MHPFRSAVEAGDFDAISRLLDKDVVFRSPIAHRRYQGRDMVVAILGAVSKVFEDFTYDREIGSAHGGDHALVFDTRIGDLAIQGCDILHTREDGLIDEFTVMLRPLNAVTVFAEKMRIQFEAAMREMAAANNVEVTR